MWQLLCSRAGRTAAGVSSYGVTVMNKPTRVSNRRVRAIWEEIAPFWDERMGDGNDFHSRLVGPTVEGLLKVASGETVLDIACGNGVFARRLADLGAHVVACDFAETFLERARARDEGSGRDIDYRVVDATDERALLRLGERRFDAAVCNMALMDMVAIEPLFRAIPRLLKPAGRFVFTVQHPCFNNNGIRFAAEEEDREGRLVVTHSLRITDYLGIPPGRVLGIVGQPEAHYYFHRPLSELLNAAFDAGLVMDGVAEPAFPAGSPASHTFSWANHPTIPPVFAARFRPFPQD